MLCVAAAVLGVGTAQLGAWSIWDHWDMTEEDLENQGWGEEARDIAIDCNMATDLLASNWSFFFPAASGRKDDVEALIADAEFNTDNSNGFHFDNLNSYDDIVERWEALETWAEAEVDEMVEDGWGAESRETFICLVGVVQHAVQDFYAHSNWVKLLNEYVGEPYTEDTDEDDVNSDQFPTWDELHDSGEWGGWSEGTSDADVIGRLQQSNENPGSGTENEDDDGLQTGQYPEEDGGPWDHRHPGGAEGAVGEALSVRASATWKEKLLGFLDEACRDDVLEYVGAAPTTGAGAGRVDQSAAATVIDVLESVLGTLGAVEQVHAFVAAGDLAATFTLTDGQLVAFSRGAYPGDTIDVWAASEDVLTSVVTAPDPEAAAQAAMEAGTLVIRRLQPVQTVPTDTAVPMSPRPD